jgi:hypothetical protein
MILASICHIRTGLLYIFMKAGAVGERLFRPIMVRLMVGRLGVVPPAQAAVLALVVAPLHELLRPLPTSGGFKRILAKKSVLPEKATNILMTISPKKSVDSLTWSFATNTFKYA